MAFTVNDLVNVANLVRAVPPHAPEAAIAFSICQLRGRDPYAMPPISQFGLTNWQTVIAEQLLQAELRQVLGPRPANGAGVGILPGESIGQRHG